MVGGPGTDEESGAEPIPRAAGDADRSPELVGRRRALCERAAGRPLPQLFGAPVSAEETRGNVENFVGFAQVPVGIAGPLSLDTSAGPRRFLVPMATSEGALVASCSRGMALLGAGGRTRARVLAHGLTQNPMLVYRDAAAAGRAAQQAEAALEDFRGLTASITRHGRLLAARPQLLGRRLVLVLSFATGDAIGINMAARAADLCSRELGRRTGALEVHVHGQDVEKRANARALIEGRGRSVVCDGRVPRAELERRARTTPAALCRILDSYRVGFAQLGTHNWTVQSANALAAVLIATGQDVAYLPECATGFLDFDVTPEGDLYASMTLPSLLVGTVGGGSGKGTAAECLDLLGVRDEGGADLLAEVLAATCLAGDVSLMAAFCAGEFVDAHERLGRNRPPPGPELPPSH